MRELNDFIATAIGICLLVCAVCVTTVIVVGTFNALMESTP